MIGRELGNLRITNFLGRGRFGEVFRAEDRAEPGRRVVLRAVLPNGAGLPALADSLGRLVDGQHRLDHPAILPYRRLLIEDDACFLLMDYYNASPLGRVVEPDGIQPVAHALGLFRSTVDAVAHAYREGLVHGRINGRQVLYGIDRRLRVADFGLAEATRGAVQEPDDGDAASAPELRSGAAPATPCADVYSLGVLLFHLLAGRPPEIEGPSVVDQLRAARPESTPPLHALVAAATAAEPAERPRDPAELLELLDAEPVVAGRIVALGGRHRPAAAGPDPRPKAAPKPQTEPETVAVPAGVFTLGSATSPNEQPVHELDLPPFRIGRFPVTNRQYAVFCAATDRTPPPDPPGWKDYFAGHPDHPVVQVSWHDATAYCQWLAAETGRSFRLPTEAQWEKAARGGLEGAPYPWGEAAPEDHALFAGTVRPWSPGSGIATVPVGCFAANAYGLHDAAGLVWEWCEDWYARYGAGEERRRRGIYRVVRGGAWNSDADSIRTSFRMSFSPGYRDPSTGFRVAEEWAPGSS